MLDPQKITFSAYSVNVWENAHIVECSYTANSPDFELVCLVFVHCRNGKIADYVFSHAKRAEIENWNLDFHRHVRSTLNDARVKSDIRKAFVPPINAQGIIDPKSLPNFEYVYDEYD